VNGTSLYFVLAPPLNCLIHQRTRQKRQDWWHWGLGLKKEASTLQLMEGAIAQQKKGRNRHPTSEVHAAINSRKEASRRLQLVVQKSCQRMLRLGCSSACALSTHHQMFFMKKALACIFLLEEKKAPCSQWLAHRNPYIVCTRWSERPASPSRRIITLQGCRCNKLHKW
jgi:hypothetical protein